MKKIQQDFFVLIKQRVPAYINLAQNIAGVLEISNNESYKKINGKSPLSLHHILKLCNHYAIPFTYSPAGAVAVNFSYPELNKESAQMMNHLKRILAQLQLVKDAEHKQLMIATDDIPFFYLFKHLELSLFKLSYWQSSLAEHSTKFASVQENEELIQLISDIHALYLEIPATEIWSKNALLGTIDQIKYAFDAGIIESTALALLLVEQLQDVLDNIGTYAITGKKTTDDKHLFEWFQCDVVGSVTFLLKFENYSMCFNRFNTFNYLETTDEVFCKNTEQWIQKLIKKSTCFSGHGEKYRNIYLNQSQQSCADLISYIKGY